MPLSINQCWLSITFYMNEKYSSWLKNEMKMFSFYIFPRTFDEWITQSKNTKKKYKMSLYVSKIYSEMSKPIGLNSKKKRNFWILNGNLIKFDNMIFFFQKIQSFISQNPWCINILFSQKKWKLFVRKPKSQIDFNIYQKICNKI